MSTIEFITGKRGGQNAINEGYAFHVNRLSDGSGNGCSLTWSLKELLHIAKATEQTLNSSALWDPESSAKFFCIVFFVVYFFFLIFIILI